MTHRSVLVLALLAACGGGGSASETPDAACQTQKFYPDVDHDGFGDSSKVVETCEAPAGYIAKGGDCIDTNAAVHPGAAEVCDQVDNNCDGLVDDADPTLVVTTGTTFYLDADNDGFGVASATRQACARPAGYADNADDCDDGDAAVNPSATEVCDQRDNNCNGLVDTADPALDLSTAHSYYRDVDHDGYGAGSAMIACTPPSGYVATAGDCNDNDATSHPGGTEVCDGADNDCDGGVDGTVAAPHQCTALVGTYAGTYSHSATEQLGGTIINQMTCTSTGSGTLAFGRTPALQGTFNCVYTGGLTLFSHTQTVTLRASVGLDGAVTGTVDHVYNTIDDLRRTYTVTGTLTATHLTLSGMGSFLPNTMAVQPWDVLISISATR